MHIFIYMTDKRLLFAYFSKLLQIITIRIDSKMSNRIRIEAPNAECSPVIPPSCPLSALVLAVPVTPLISAAGFLVSPLGWTRSILQQTAGDGIGVEGSSFANLNHFSIVFIVK